jgi:PAS domain-containing protein
MDTNEEYPLQEMVDFASLVVGTNAFAEVLTSLIEAFKLPRFLENIGIRADEAAMRRLEAKVAAHLLDQLTTDRIDAPYISVWEKGRHQEVKMVYINPAIEKITGFSARKVLRIGFSIFVPDDLITRVDRSGQSPVHRQVPIEQEREERQQAALQGRWERIYEILTRNGTSYVKDVAIIEEVGSLCISSGTLIDITDQLDDQIA